MSISKYNREQQARLIRNFEGLEPEHRGDFLREFGIDMNDIYNWKRKQSEPQQPGKAKGRNDVAEKIMNFLKREEFLNEGLVDADYSYARGKIAEMVRDEVRKATRKVPVAEEAA